MQSAISNVLIVANSKNHKASTLIHDIKDYFKKKSIKVILHSLDEPFDENKIDKIDLAISLGGDGTLLYCARQVASKETPILAVNTGNFGFITEISCNEWKEAFEKFMQNQLDCSKRILIQIDVIRGSEIVHQIVGLNDAVITTNGIPHLINLKLFLSQSYVGRYKADGVIIATATGSTAYSMGAGGPIMHPEMEAFILNPICPFTLSNRPLIVPGNEMIEIEVEENKDYELVLSVDGANIFTLKARDRIVCKKAARKAFIIRSDKRNFYEVLRSKLKWSGEPNA
jgi:NAD+ kinase